MSGNAHRLIPGHGRNKGSLNKWKAMNAEWLQKGLDNRDFDVLDEFVANYRDPKCATSTRAKMLDTIMTFMLPKVKAVEHSGSVEHRAFQMSWDVNEHKAAAVEHAEVIDATPLTTVDSEGDDDAGV